jgi:hypothetical protein
MVLVFLHLHELGAEDTESQLTVLELRTLGLRADQQTGGKVPYLDGRVALVPILAARPRAAASGDLHLVILEPDFLGPGNPQYGDGDGAGMDPAVAFVRGDPLPAMSACLILE